MTGAPPALVAATFTETVQAVEPIPAGAGPRVPPLTPRLARPGFAVTLAPGHVVVAPVGLAIVMPAGSASVMVSGVSGDAFRFVIVRVKVATPPLAMVAGEKALVT